MDLIRDSQANLYNCDSVPHFPPKKSTIVALRLGSERKKYLTKYPNLSYYKRKILAQRLLYFNYRIGFNPRTKPSKDQETQDEVPASLDWCKSNPTVTIPRKYKGTPGPAKRNRDVAQIDEPETPDEEWQRQKFAKRMRQDATSTKVFEIVIQARMAACSRKDLGTCDFVTRQTIYLETLRAAINAHDWPLACKSAEGVAEDSSDKFTYCLLWTGGFLATINSCHDDLEKLREFAQMIQTFYPASPLAGVEIATWFTQKGAFLEGNNLLKAEIGRMQRRAQHKPHYYRVNVKRDLLDFVVDLFDAVYHYSCYKKEQMDSIIRSENDETSMQRTGQDALNRFNVLLSRAMKLDLDITIIIEPLIELTITFGSKKEAKDILQKVCLRYFGNGVLEELYLKFLRKHFPSHEKEIRNKQKKFKRYEFDINKRERLTHEQILRRYLEAESSDNNQIPLKQLSMPGFSF